MRPLIAEAFGTFTLVFAGTGAIVVNDERGGAITHVGIALTFGLVVTALIYGLGRISGCHLNPAVTLGLWWGGRFERPRVPGYILAQCVGAIMASALLLGMFTNHPTLGATEPHGPPLRSFLLEFLLTLILMVVIFGATEGDATHLAGVAIGAVIGLEAMFAGPICGASMNPARSLGPALMAGRLEHLWLYLSAPILGAAAGVGLWHVLQPLPKPRDS